MAVGNLVTRSGAAVSSQATIAFLVTHGLSIGSAAPPATAPVRALKAAYPVPPANSPDAKLWMRQIAQSVQGVLGGKMNVCLDVTLNANATTTTIIDPRISYFNAIHLVPLTANAAAALGTTYVSAQLKGQATLTHANDANTDKTFRVVFLG